MYDRVLKMAAPLHIEVNDTPGKDGAQRRYVVAGFDTSKNPSLWTVDTKATSQVILLNSGKKADGVTTRALLAIVADHLRSKTAQTVGESDAMAHTAAALNSLS